MKFKILIPIFIILLLASIVSAGLTLNSWTVPAQYSVQNSTTVTYTLNVTGDESTFNCSALAATNRSQLEWTEAQLGLVSNNTINETTTTYSEGSRNWVKLTCFDTPGSDAATGEVTVVPAVGIQIALTYDTDGICTTCSSIIGVINYTNDVVNESSTLPANASQVTLAGNTSITAVTELIIYNGSDNITHSSGSYNITRGMVYLLNASIATNTSYWTYTYTNESKRLEGNYNSSSGLIYFNGSTNYVGDVLIMNYTYPYEGSHRSQVNSSVRIFDVDTDYWDYLNISLGVDIAGDLIVRGEVTVLNPTEGSSQITLGPGIESVSLAVPGLTIGASTGNVAIIMGINSSNYGTIDWYGDSNPDYMGISTNAANRVLALQDDGGEVGIGTTDPNSTLHVVGDAIISSDVDILGNVEISGNLNVDDNFTGDFYYGEMWNYTSNATAWTFALTEGIYHNLTGLVAGNINGFTFFGNATGAGGSYLVADVAGIYHIDMIISADPVTANDLIATAVTNNFDATANRQCYARTEVISGVSPIDVHCLMDIAAGDKINIQMENEESGGDVEIHTVNLNLIRMGD